MKNVKRIVSLLLVVIMALGMFTGCGKKETSLQVTDKESKTKLSVDVTDTKSKCNLKSQKNGFVIDTGDGKVYGSFMSVADAENLQANSFGTSEYKVVTIGDATDGYSCMLDGEYVHVFKPAGSDVYICLSSSNSESNIYVAEENVSFAVNTKK